MCGPPVADLVRDGSTVRSLSTDGVSAFDLISRGAMLQGLREVNEEALPFVRLFYGQPSTFLWEGDDNIVHSTPQGEGGEQASTGNCKQWHVWNMSGVRPLRHVGTIGTTA